MKKILLSLLLVSFVVQLRGMQAEPTATVPPLFSVDRLKLIYRYYADILDQYKRCLFTVGCTPQEYEQVKQTLNVVGKAVVGITAAYLAYTYGLPATKKQLEAIKVTAKKVTREMVAEVTAQLKQDLPSIIKNAEPAVRTIVNAAGEEGQKTIAQLLIEGGSVDGAVRRLLNAANITVDQAGKDLIARLSQFLEGVQATWGPIEGLKIKTSPPPAAPSTVTSPAEELTESGFVRSAMQPPSLLESLTAVPQPTRGVRRPELGEPGPASSSEAPSRSPSSLSSSQESSGIEGLD